MDLAFSPKSAYTKPEVVKWAKFKSEVFTSFVKVNKSATCDTKTIN